MSIGNGKVVWFTGMSGAGKTTVSSNVLEQLERNGELVKMLDGDVVRKGLCSDLGFSHADRTENVRRVAEVAALFADSGFTCIVALVSPYQIDREKARSCVGAERFIEVFVDAPLEVCRARDPKGLYAKADVGEVKKMTGVSHPYEAPENPDVHLHTDVRSVEECAGEVMSAIVT